MTNATTAITASGTRYEIFEHGTEVTVRRLHAVNIYCPPEAQRRGPVDHEWPDGGYRTFLSVDVVDVAHRFGIGAVGLRLTGSEDGPITTSPIVSLTDGVLADSRVAFWRGDSE